MEKVLIQKLIEIRQDLHQHPELGFREYRTSAIVQSQLKELDIPYEIVAETGVFATLQKGDGPTVILRADMDALPVKEDTGLSFTSQTENVMHACGHDLHTAILIGAACLLKDENFKGTVKFLFQPSEEGNLRSPEVGKSGGQIIAETGKLNEAKAIIGLHVHPMMPLGTLGYTEGEALSNVCNFVIRVIGKAGHAGGLEHAVDPVLISSQLIVAAQGLMTHTAPAQAAVLAFTTTKIKGEPAYNLIPEEVILTGSLRALSLSTYQLILTKLENLFKGMEISYSCKIEMELTAYYPSLLNDAALNQELSTVQRTVFNQPVIQQEGQLVAEDFAFYSRQIPAVFYFLGAKIPAEHTYFLHHPKVIFNEECIPLGSTFLAKAAVHLLQ